MEWHAPLLNPFERFFERVHDEPEEAAHFAQKVASNLADSLGDHRRLTSICHVHGEIASLRRMEKGKVEVFL